MAWADVEADHIAQFVVLPAGTSNIYARRDEPVGFVTGLGIAVASICGARISSSTPVQAKTERSGRPPRASCSHPLECKSIGSRPQTDSIWVCVPLKLWGRRP